MPQQQYTLTSQDVDPSQTPQQPVGTHYCNTADNKGAMMENSTAEASEAAEEIKDKKEKKKKKKEKEEVKMVGVGELIPLLEMLNVQLWWIYSCPT